MLQKRPDDKVAIFGAGTIGLSALAAMKASGIDEVVITDISPLRLDKALRLGASAVFNACEGGTADYLAKRHGSEINAITRRPEPNTDIIVECAGAQ